MSDSVIRSMAERNSAIRASFRLPERILYALSKDVGRAFRGGADPYADAPTDEWDPESALSLLRREFPVFDRMILNQRVLDYGCGDGFQSVAMAKFGASEVLGVDTNESRLACGRRMAAGLANVSFSAAIPAGNFDVAISQNSFEHFPEPSTNLVELATAVRQGGRILITFGPPWLAPYGSHMHFFSSFPWINILFSEETVFRVRSLYRMDGASAYWPGLNKMTVALFEKLVRESGLEVEYRRYKAVKNMTLFVHVPILRELFVNNVSCILAKH